MKTKIFSVGLLILVICGTLYATSDLAVIKESSLMTKLFLGFFAAIILLQIIPGVLLFSGLIKGIFTREANPQNLKGKS
ncbi:MAG: hypothetical protein P8X63_07715 [Desulfuromonadaceae bacterium]